MRLTVFALMLALMISVGMAQAATKEDIQHLEAEFAKTKNDISIQIASTTNEVVGYVNQSIANFEAQIFERFDPMRFLIPIFSFVGTIFFLYLFFLGSMWARYFRMRKAERIAQKPKTEESKEEDKEPKVESEGFQ